MKKWRKSVLFGFGIIGVYLVLTFLRLPNNSILWLEIHNAGHTPLFGLLALFVLGLTWNYFERIRRIRAHYLLAFTLSVFCGLMLEIYQIWGPGDSDVIDLVRDMAGAISFLAIFAIFDRRWRITSRRSISGMKIIVGFLGISVLIASLTPLALWSAAYILRNKNFPEIVAFESPIERKFARSQNSYFSIVNAPDKWDGKRGKVGQLILGKGNYPGIAVREPYPDWSGYQTLRLEVYLSFPKPLSCTLRIHDSQHDESYHDRYNGQINLKPGPNEINISLADVRRAPANRLMNMKEIRSLILIAQNGAPACTLYIANIKLE